MSYKLEWIIYIISESIYLYCNNVLKTFINLLNELISNLLNELFLLTKVFPVEGFKAYKSNFEQLDLLNGKLCKVISNNSDKVVEVLGVNDQGELLVKENLEYLTLRYGEVSIREL